MHDMQITFTKMHGLGNDFVVIDWQQNSSQTYFSLPSQTISALANRHTGIGFDQMLVIEPPRNDDVLAHYRVFNADGSEVEQCGNGARCIAAVLAKRDGIDKGSPFRLGSEGGTISVRVLADDTVQVELSAPDFSPPSVPFNQPQQRKRYAIALRGEIINAAAVSLGNPHCVLFVDDIETAPVERLGPALASHKLFPEGVNVGFAEVVNRGHIRLRVFERGVGETRACGTGACAAMVCARDNGLVDDEVEISLPGGTLVINWRNHNEPVVMTGPAAFSFEGTVQL